MQHKHFIFDVDGTLTPSRQIIDDTFKQFFLSFCKKNSVSLVSGSDYEKTFEQLGPEICDSVHYIFSCSGNSVRNNYTKTIETRHLDYMPDLELRLTELLHRSDFFLKTGNHIEYRPGGINFSIIGRNANTTQRSQYVIYDKSTNEREIIARTLNEEFPHLETTIGGETGVDIVAAGCNKAQIISYFSTDTMLLFFGDSTARGGNDYPLANVIVSNKLGKVYTVSSWQDTYAILLRI